MASKLLVTTELVVDHYLVTAEIQDGGSLPKEIFIFENSGTATLGKFYGTCSASELGRLQVFTGNAIPVFGNRWVRASPAKIIVSLGDDPASVVAGLVKNVLSLSQTLQAKIKVTQLLDIQ